MAGTVRLGRDVSAPPPARSARRPADVSVARTRSGGPVLRRRRGGAMLVPMARTLFGTDGVRGVAGEKLTAGLALALGRAATTLSPASAPRVLIVRDTRESGEMLEAALAAGVSAAGGEAVLGGVVPTPAAAIAVTRGGYDLAAVISASHNPFHDNGIKFFGPSGDKLSDEAEEAIERALEAPATSGPPVMGRVRRAGDTLADYLA